MAKRKLFDELKEGFDALRDEREGKVTLKTTSVKPLDPIEINASEIIAIRKRYNVSQPVFANMLRVNPRTLAGWENGRKVNPSAATLIKLAKDHPEVLEMVAQL